MFYANSSRSGYIVVSIERSSITGNFVNEAVYMIEAAHRAELFLTALPLTSNPRHRSAPPHAS